jgi:hypothetical protein
MNPDIASWKAGSIKASLPVAKINDDGPMRSRKALAFNLPNKEAEISSAK